MKKLNDSVAITLIIVSGIILLSLMGMFYWNSLNPSNTISSSGYATIKTMPDIVSVYFNVQTYGTTSSEASDENSKIVEAMKNSLNEGGFSDEEIQTQGFSVYPEYDYSKSNPTITRYVAVHSLKVEMPADERSNIGKVIDSGVNAGAGISYINFELSQERQNAYKAEAIKQATVDAKTKAEALAEGAGEELGKLVSVSTSDFYYQPWQIFASSTGKDTVEAREAATSITPS